jgi:hypothetical protein
MSKRRHRQSLAAIPGRRTAPRGESPTAQSEHFHCALRPFPREDAVKIVPIRENDDNLSAKLDIVDAIAREVDAMWGLIGTLQTIYTETGCDAYARGALRIAHAHLDSLCAIQHDLDKLLQSEP